MAHNCPDCYALCHCGGDIDDILFDDNDFCTHWEQCERDDYEDDDDAS